MWSSRISEAPGYRKNRTVLQTSATSGAPTGAQSGCRPEPVSRCGSWSTMACIHDAVAPASQQMIASAAAGSPAIRPRPSRLTDRRPTVRRLVNVMLTRKVLTVEVHVRRPRFRMPTVRSCTVQRSGDRNDWSERSSRDGDRFGAGDGATWEHRSTDRGRRDKRRAPGGGQAIDMAWPLAGASVGSRAARERRIRFFKPLSGTAHSETPGGPDS